MTRNERYWTERANRRMDNYTISAMEQAKIIQRSYNQTYNYVQSEISKILRHIGDEGTLAYEYRMKRLNTLLIKMDRKMRQLYNINIKDTTSFLKKIIPEAYYHTIFDISQGLGYLPQFSAVNTRLINQIVTDQWSGKNYSERIWWNVDKLAVDTRQILTTAAMTGESIYKTSRRLSQRFGQSAYCSQRLIRTETTYSCNQAELTAYKELDIEKYKFVATLDTRTSPACQGLDGKVFAVKDAKAGINLPAMHPNCRSTTISFFEGYEPTVRAARDKDGKRIKVPADMTYPEWYKKYIGNGSQNTPTPSKGNDTPKPAEAPQKPSVKPTEGNAVEVPVSEPVNPSGAYTDVPIPENVNNQSIDNSVQNDIIEEGRLLYLNDIEDFENWQNDYYKFNNGVSFDRKDNPCIYEYTGGSYEGINAVLRGGEYLERTKRRFGTAFNQEKFETLAEGISKELSKFKLNETLELKRSVGSVGFITGASSSIEDMKKSIGKVYIEKGFTSATVCGDAFLPFGGTKPTKTTLEIVADPRYTRGVYIYKISEHSPEFEFLIDKNTKYRIIDAGEREIEVKDFRGKIHKEKERFMRLKVIKND